MITLIDGEKDRTSRWDETEFEGVSAMSDEELHAASTELNATNASCPTGGHGRRSGLMRAVLYTPVVVLVSGLAALATFPELARYATPLTGESSGGNYTCPLSALASRMGCGSCSSKSSTDLANAVLAMEPASDAPSGCCARAALARFSCCAQPDACPSSSTTEQSDEADSPVTENAPSADEAPADAFTTANSTASDAPSN